MRVCDHIQIITFMILSILGATVFVVLLASLSVIGAMVDRLNDKVCNT